MKVILFRGRPGTGKTTLSKLLAGCIHSMVLSKDDLYDAVAAIIPDHDLRNKAAHDALYRILKSNSTTPITIILDFPFQTDSDLNVIKRWCNDNCVNLKTILVTCSNEVVWSARLQSRNDNPSPNQLITSFEEFKKRYGVMHLTAKDDELLADTVEPADIILERIIKYIE